MASMTYRPSNIEAHSVSGRSWWYMVSMAPLKPFVTSCEVSLLSLTLRPFSS